MKFQWTDGIAARCLGSDIRTKLWSGGEADVIAKHQFVTAKGLVVALNVSSNDYLRGPSRNPWYVPSQYTYPTFTTLTRTMCMRKITSALHSMHTYEHAFDTLLTHFSSHPLIPSNPINILSFLLPLY